MECRLALRNKHNILKSGVIKIAFSDHYVVYCSRKFRGAFSKDHKLILCRKLKNFNYQTFLQDVSNMPWDTIVRSCGTLDENIDKFIEALALLIERHAPLQQRRVSQKYCPWLTSDFYKLRKARGKLKKAAIKTKSTFLMASYRHVRNKVNLLNSRLKKEYYSNKVQENIGNIRQTWKIVNEIVNKTSKTTKIDSIKVNDRVITDKKVIPNIMNTYFCSVGENLKSKIPYEPNPLTTGVYSINNNLKSFNFIEITAEDVVNACSTIKTSHGSGVDGISSFFIKTAIYFLARPLSYIFNCSLLNGTFPDSWKVARVAPIFKEGSADELSNYRPISVLPVLSRLFEKLVYNQLYNYLNEYQFIYRHQSGFRSFHSVVTCLLSNTNDWYFNLDEGKCTGIVFVDLKKAFDTVDHEILISKLSHYGVKNTELKWFCSYLSNRRQCCKVNGESSNFEYIRCGVPQGSCLGPLLFLLYINDMPYALKYSKTTMYADDTSLAYSAKSVSDISNVMNYELESLRKWLFSNKLSLNVAKTTSMLIGTRNRLQDKSNGELHRTNFNISDELIEQKTCVKYLGIQIDSQLKWKEHVESVSLKVSRAIGMIKYAKKFLPTETLKLLYRGLIEPHLRFCCSVWGSCGASTRKILERLQNRSVRIITNSPYDAPAEPLLKSLGLPSVNNMIYQESASMVYKAVNNQAPIYLTTLFNRVSSVTSRSLRNSELNIRPPRLKTKHGQNCFAYRGAMVWNSLPSDCKKANSFQSYKMKLKAMLAKL